MTDLECVEILIGGADHAYGRLIVDCLKPLHFSLDTERDKDQILVGPGGAVYTVRHQLRCWRSYDYGRLVWFSLDSQIPHMSTIVACMAFPHENSGWPLFCMNLNLKLRVRTYNTIIGYRGHPDCLSNLAPFVPKLNVQDGYTPCPVLSKPCPEGFVGVRAMFRLESTPIYWSLTVAEASIHHWFDAVRRSTPTHHSSLASQDERYAQEMMSLHGREAGVYDAVFGDGWLSNLFSRHVFQ